MSMMQKMKSIPLSYHAITMILSLYYALVMNLPLYHSLHSIFNQLDQVDTGFVISIPLFLFFSLNILFSLFTWPKATQVFFSVLLISSCLVCYSSYHFGTIFDQDMIESVIDTNPGEATSYLSLIFVLWFLGLGVLPTVLLWSVHFKSERFGSLILKKIATIVISALGLLIIASLYYQNYVSVGRNNSYLKKIIVPTYYVHSIAKYIDENYFTQPMPYKQIGLDAIQKPTAQNDNHKPTLLVFVLGETARSQNYQLNGYPRETNPFTKTSGIVSFRHVHSCGTDTALSVPCMFSRLNRKNYNERIAYHQDNLTDILKRAGIDVLWRENDAADKGIPHHVKLENITRNKSNPLCDTMSCFDSAVLNHIGNEVTAMTGNRFVVLHLIGSHGPTYDQRYPENFAHFKPTCPTADIENCTKQQIVNSYDNTIRYTDYVIAQTIDELKRLSNRYTTALIYVSDHGESLGENGLYLHGMPYSIAPEYQTKVPMMVWMSKNFIAEKHINQKCIQMEANHQAFSHDNLFDSILGIMDVHTRLYRPDDDIFMNCRASHTVLAKTPRR